jgi:hypothetical protein
VLGLVWGKTWTAVGDGQASDPVCTFQEHVDGRTRAGMRAHVREEIVDHLP